jgi:hypothetical protein
MNGSNGWVRVGLVCAALMVAPGAFAQHGGGGHAGGGGGGHFGGGGGGYAPAPAAHSNSGNASHGNSNSGANASHGTAAATATPANGSNAANPNGGGRFVNGGTAAPVRTAGVVAARPNAIFGQPRGRGGYYPYYPYGYGFYGYPYGYYGFGFGGPCDPFFGCYGFGSGFGFGAGFGYGYGGGFGLFGGGGGDMSGWTYSSQGNGVGTGAATSGGDYTVDASGGNGADATVAANPAESNGTADASGPTVNLNSGAAAPAAAPVTTVLYMRDGSSFAVSDYWLAGGKLHYVTSYGGENSTDLGKLDIQKSVDENAKQGEKFALKSAPGTAQK